MPGETARTRFVRTNRGRLTIPAAIRRQLGIDEGTPVRLNIEGDEYRIVPIHEAGPNRGSPWLRDLYEHLASVREEILVRGISEAEVNADIDAALAEVRAERRANLE